MAKVKYIPCDIYKRGISVFIGSLKEFKGWVKREYTDGIDKGFAEMVERLDEDNVGIASFNYNNQDGHWTQVTLFNDIGLQFPANIIPSVLNARVRVMQSRGWTFVVSSVAVRQSGTKAKDVIFQTWDTSKL